MVGQNVFIDLLFNVLYSITQSRYYLVSVSKAQNLFVAALKNDGSNQQEWAKHQNGSHGYKCMKNRVFVTFCVGLLLSKYNPCAYQLAISLTKGYGSLITPVIDIIIFFLYPFFSPSALDRRATSKLDYRTTLIYLDYQLFL